MLQQRMRDLRARRAAGETGFTLVELLVVVVIIVALAAIAVPVFLNQKEKADEGVAASDATTAGKVLASAVSTESALTVVDGVGGSISTAGTTAAGEQSATTSGTLTVVNADGSDFTSGGTPISTTCVEINVSGEIASYSVADGAGTGCP